MWMKFYNGLTHAKLYFGEKNMKEVPNAGDRLCIAAETYKERNKQYGNSYKMHGKIISALFPDGIKLETVEDHNRYAIINTVVSKMNRYCNNFNKGGHQDSIHDLGVYSFMLEELDDEAKAHYSSIFEEPIDEPRDPL